MDRHLISELMPALHEAGQKILQVRESQNLQLRQKSDLSPLTEADLISHQILTSAVERLTGELVISEESDLANIGDFSGHKTFWLIDPLDGTKDFVAGKSSFCINVARIVQGRPNWGMIYAPSFAQTYWAQVGQGAYRLDSTGQELQIFNRSTHAELKVVASGHLMTDRLRRLLETLPVQSLERFGSAIKMCRIAEGVADVYPRIGPTHEWDTAAGQVILEESGCRLLDLRTGQPIRYGKPGLLNSGFLALRGDLDLWPKISTALFEMKS